MSEIVFCCEKLRLAFEAEKIKVSSDLVIYKELGNPLDTCPYCGSVMPINKEFTRDIQTGKKKHPKEKEKIKYPYASTNGTPDYSRYMGTMMVSAEQALSGSMGYYAGVRFTKETPSPLDRNIINRRLANILGDDGLL